MSEHQDPLSQLWHEQKVDEPDFSVIVKKWRITKLKQRVYVLLDVLSVLFVFGAWIYLADKMDDFTNLYLGGLCIISVGFTLYIIWLRRFSLGWSIASTDKHLHMLKKQVNNNIKIAWITKHSTWVILLLIGAHHLSLYYLQVFPEDRLLKKVLVSFALLSVMVPALWIWADRRAKRFKRELAALNDLTRSDELT